jgi:hypothetical protein
METTGTDSAMSATRTSDIDFISMFLPLNPRIRDSHGRASTPCDAAAGRIDSRPDIISECPTEYDFNGNHLKASTQKWADF